MPALKLIADADAQGKVAELYERIRGRMQTIPNAYRAMAGAPGFLSDMLDNHAKIMADGAVDRKTKELIALAISAVTGCEYCAAAHAAVARRMGIPEQQLVEAVGLAAIMSGHNHVQKLKDFSADEELKTLRTGTAESLMKEKSLTDLQMELIFLAVSSINGCPTCIKYHTGKARKVGATTEQLQETAAVLALLSASTTFIKALGLDIDLK